MDIVRLGPGDEDLVAEAEYLFDDPIDASSTKAFLRDQNHHLLMAYVDGSPAGFISAVETYHPDKKGPEVFLYELGVDEQYRRQGIASALIDALVDLSRDRKCRGIWVLTELDNEPAIRTYEKADAEADDNLLMFTIDLS